jgi:hypothetical protein
LRRERRGDGVIIDASMLRVHPKCRVKFDRRVFSREAAKNAKEKACYEFSVPLLEENSSTMEFRPLRVLCGFA